MNNSNAVLLHSNKCEIKPFYEMTPSLPLPLGKRKRADTESFTVDDERRKARSKRKNKVKAAKSKITSSEEAAVIHKSDGHKHAEDGDEHRPRKKKKEEKHLKSKTLKSWINDPVAVSHSPELQDVQAATLLEYQGQTAAGAVGSPLKPHRFRSKRGRKERHTKDGKNSPVTNADGNRIIFSNPAWSISSPVGGRLLDTVPRLSQDEK